MSTWWHPSHSWAYQYRAGEIWAMLKSNPVTANVPSKLAKEVFKRCRSKDRKVKAKRGKRNTFPLIQPQMFLDTLHTIVQYRGDEVFTCSQCGALHNNIQGGMYRSIYAQMREGWCGERKAVAVGWETAFCGTCAREYFSFLNHASHAQLDRNQGEILYLQKLIKRERQQLKRSRD